MKIRKLDILFSLLFFLGASLLSGCGLTSLIVHPFGGHRSSLKKRVMVTPLIDQAGLGHQVSSELYQTLIDRLRATGKVVVFENNHTVSLDSSEATLAYGISPGTKLLQKARDLGMNAVLTGVISPVEKEERLKGIWPLRKAVAHYSIALIFNLLDPQDGTVILSHLEDDGIDVDLEEEQFLEKNWILEELKEKILSKVIKRAIKPIRKALESEPWEGRILAVKDQILINAGADVGVKPGHRFEVYGGNQIIVAKDGRKFQVSWKKVGKIRVTEVRRTTAIAEPVEGEGFKAGQKIVSLD